MKNTFYRFFDGRLEISDYYLGDLEDTDISGAEYDAADMVHELGNTLTEGVKIDADPVTGTVTIEYPDELTADEVEVILSDAAIINGYYVRPALPNDVEDLLDGILENSYEQYR